MCVSGTFNQRLSSIDIIIKIFNFLAKLLLSLNDQALSAIFQKVIESRNKPSRRWNSVLGKKLLNVGIFGKGMMFDNNA